MPWRLVLWVALCLGLFVAAASVPPLIGPALAVAGLFATFKILVVATEGYGRGLSDHRQ